MSTLRHDEVKPIVGPFREDATCPKCGGSSIYTCYAEAQGGCGSYCHPPVPERIVRRCDRCRFTWWESPLEAS